jgi:hypothetical protein
MSGGELVLRPQIQQLVAEGRGAVIPSVGVTRKRAEHDGIKFRGT